MSVNTMRVKTLIQRGSCFEGIFQRPCEISYKLPNDYFNNNAIMVLYLCQQYQHHQCLHSVATIA